MPRLPTRVESKEAAADLQDPVWGRRPGDERWAALAAGEITDMVSRHDSRQLADLLREDRQPVHVDRVRHIGARGSCLAGCEPAFESPRALAARHPERCPYFAGPNHEDATISEAWGYGVGVGMAPSLQATGDSRRGGRPTKHFGKNDKYLLPLEQKVLYPYRCIGSVCIVRNFSSVFARAWNPSGKAPATKPYWEPRGTGSLVGPRHLLTASHVVPWDSIGPDDVVGFWPLAHWAGWHKGPRFAISTFAKAICKYKDSQEYVTHAESAYDYAVCILSHRLGDELGWMGVRDFDCSKLGKHVWETVGYSNRVQILLVQRMTTWNAA